MLYVYGNQIASLPSWISELTELTALQVHHNPLQSIPASIQSLSKLRELIIDGGSPSAASSAIGNLPHLTTLAIARLGLRSVPKWLSGLTRLETLYLHNNRLRFVPEWLPTLPHLATLYLESNQLQALPTSFALARSLRRLGVADNPQLGIPSEICHDQDARKVLRYYFRTLVGPAQPLNEFKLILVRRGGVGKTSLVHRLVNNRYKAFRRTPGINITKWPMRLAQDEVLAHVWDFDEREPKITMPIIGYRLSDHSLVQMYPPLCCFTKPATGRSSSIENCFDRNTGGLSFF
jgi:internalin A